MVPNITHPERFARGVVKHPHFDPIVGGAPGDLTKGGFHAVFHTSILDICVGRNL